MSALTLPERIGSRQEARRLLGLLPEDLGECVVTIDCSGLLVTTPSFIDEVVKIVLCERGAQVAELRNADDTVVRYAVRSATSREVGRRLRVADKSTDTPS